LTRNSDTRIASIRIGIQIPKILTKTIKNYQTSGFSMGGAISLYVVKNTKYRSVRQQYVAEQLRINKNILFVSLGTPYQKLAADLRKGPINIGNILFIDTISRPSTRVKAPNVVYIDSAELYTEISIAIKNALKAGIDFVVFDSLSILASHKDGNRAFRFVEHLTNFSRRLHKNTTLFLLEKDSESTLAINVQPLADKIIGKQESIAKGAAITHMQNLFGPQASQAMQQIKAGVKVAEVFDKLKSVLTELVGPENAEKQMEELYQKFGA
jgi:KaiC/GvpD/RAD55 family RecA-like ATPase